MSHRVCPSWLGYLLASPIRRWFQGDPELLLKPYIRDGMTVLEPGPGMGFFTIPLARLVGSTGRVIAVDLQPKMIAALKRRAAKANLLDRIDARVTTADTLGIVAGTSSATAAGVSPLEPNLVGKVDFTLAFAVVHELPDSKRFFCEIAAASRPGASLLLVEPAGHVKDADFARELDHANEAGFVVASRPEVSHSLSALLTKTGTS